MKLRSISSLLVVLVLMGCVETARERVQASAKEIAEAVYVSDEPPSITLLTMVNESGGFGEHSGLLINASQQVLYDPAGSFRHSTAPNLHDMNYGMHPAMVDYYKSYHARYGYYVVAQKIEVSAELAEAIYVRALEQGQTAKLMCGISASSVLNDFALFGDIPTTYYPGIIMKRFGQIPGVETTFTREYDEGKNMEG